jgi:hypothetical protein
MPASAVDPQLLGFLADLGFVGCMFASVLYGLWVLLKRPTLVSLARMSLVVSFGAVVTLFGVGMSHGAPLSYASFYLFVLVSLFILLEFLFQMSSLGLLVSLVGLAIGALHYFPIPHAPALAAATPVVAYWWVLRDLAATVGAAVLTLGLGTAGLLYLYGDRRPSPLVHPNDLRDVAAILARGAFPCFFFATVAAVVAVVQTPSARLTDAWAPALLGLLLIVSGLWWSKAEQRQYKTGRGLGTLIVAVLLLAVYGARRALGGG